MAFGLAVLGATPPAQANYKFDLAWGSHGTGNGQFDGPTAVAVGPTGNVYVADDRNDRIEEFGPAGGFIRKWGSRGSGHGQFKDPFDLAVNGSGVVLVADYNNHRLQKFDSTGHFLAVLDQVTYINPVEVDFEPGGNIIVGDFIAPDVGYPSDIEELNAAGTYLGTVRSGLSSPVLTVVPGAGDLYYADNGDSNPVVEHLAPSHTDLGGFGVSGEVSLGPDPVLGAGAVWVSRISNDRVQRYVGNVLYDKFGGTGTGNGKFEGASGVAPYLDAAKQIAYLYVADYGNDRIERFKALPPNATITSGPGNGSYTNDSTPSFGVASSYQGPAPSYSTFQCRRDGGAWGSCGYSPHLADGQHTFEVRTTDFDGLTDLTPAKRTFTVDTAAPQTTITSGPADSSLKSDPTPTFKFKSSQSGSKFKCAWADSAGSQDYKSCTSPYTTPALHDGNVLFAVEAIDRAGNVDASPASRYFQLDTTPPQTTITSGPAAGSATRDTSATIGFSASEGGATFKCETKDAAGSSGFKPCTSPYTSPALADGPVTLSVEATDAAGNVDPSPAARSFRVDRTAPGLAIAAGSVVMSSHGKAKVKLTCPGSEPDGPCAGTLKLKTAHAVRFRGHKHRVTLGTAAYSIGSGSSHSVAVHLGADERGLVKRLGHVRVKASTMVADALGNSKVVSRSFKLKAP